MDKNDIINLIPLDKSTNDLAQQIIDEQNLAKVQDLTHLFNLNQAKKNVLRVIKLNSLLDKVSDQMIKRFEETPGQFSNADLLNYMAVTQNAIDRANKAIGLVDESPAIVVNQVNVNVEPEQTLDRDSRLRITEAVSKILQMSKEMNLVDEQDPIIEIPNEDITASDTSTVLNNNGNLLNGEEE